MLEPRAVDLRIASAMAQGGIDRPAWLDGGPTAQGWFAAEPDLELRGDDLRMLDEVQDRWSADRSRVWIGWLSYELGVDALLGRRAVPRRVPGLCLRRYPAAWRISPDGTVHSHGRPGAAARLEEAVGRFQVPEPRWPFAPLRAEWAERDYRKRVDRVLGHIAAGDTYQVNLSQPFFAPFEPAGTVPLASRVVGAYLAMRRRTPAPMGGLIAVGAGSEDDYILSNSPETLLEVRLGAGEGGADRASSQPIKGTRPRSRDAARDDAAVHELLASEKDRAEHIMIVDLVRNDLGQWAVPGTVAVDGPRRWALPTVHHMVTDVSCTLNPGWSLGGLTASLFPGGSVTGAPKRRTVELIDEIEGEARGIYCGAIVVLSPQGLCMSIPIRTGLVGADGLWLRSGGGIVIDSDPEAERVETEVKARAFNPTGPRPAR